MPEISIEPWVISKAKYDEASKSFTATMMVAEVLSKAGFIMESAEIDETGFFLVVKWKKVE